LTQGGRQSRIAKNAATGSSIVIGKIHESNSVNCSFNAEFSSYVDMVKAGIIDRPRSKIVRARCRKWHRSQVC